MPWEYSRTMIEVTSLSRPNESWSFTDHEGHVHQWEWPSGKRIYALAEPASLPTCMQVEDAPYWTEDGDEIKQFHWECKDCHEHVKPGYKPDDYQQYILGLARRRWVEP